MAKTDALFVLIKSLSRSEKRYFKRAAALHGREQNYLELFEVLDKMEQYNEVRLKTYFENRPLARQLHVAKNYLRDLVLRSLRGYQLNDSVNAQLKSRLLDIEILFNKDLLKQCYSAIRRAEKLAIKSGDEIARLEVLSWKRKVLLNMKSALEGRVALNSIQSQEQETLERLIDENTLWEMTLGITGPGDPNSDNLVDHPLLADSEGSKTFRASILQYHLRYIAHVITDNPGNAEKSLDDLIYFLESEPFKLKNDPSPYITALNNKIGLYLNQRKHELVPPLLEKIRTIPEQLKLKARSPISMKLLLRTYNVELETYRDSGQTAKALELIPKVRSFLASNEELVSREYEILLFYQFAYLYFMAGDFKKSLMDINQVLSHRGHDERGDIIGYAQFLNLIIHYELGNNTVMKYSVNASRRYFKRRGGLLEFEKLLLQLFSRLSTRPASQHRAIIAKCRAKLFSHPPLVNESQLDYLDFKYWFSLKL